jgi:hypothetical protein
MQGETRLELQMEAVAVHPPGTVTQAATTAVNEEDEK